ncbi:hypothetical protein ACLMJK_004677 [Lecanora helva]
MTCLAFNIDESCKNSNKLDQVVAAAKEAINIAQNAISRIDYSRNPGTMMLDLFGNDSPGTFEEVKKCYQDTVAKSGIYSESGGEDNLLVYCGSAHLRLIDRTSGTYRDPLHKYVDIRGIIPADNSDDACSSNAEAFGYPIPGDGKPGFIVVLCQTAFDKSDMNDNNMPILLGGWQFDGNLKNVNAKIPPPEVGVDFIKKYLSIKILHEMMHVGDCIKLPRQLPESKKLEQYGYHRIMEKNGDDYILSPKDKQSNADSYTLAAGGKCHPAIAVSSKTNIARNSVVSTCMVL